VTTQRMMLREDPPVSRRRGRPTKVEIQARAQARQATALLAGLDALTVSSQGRVSAEVYGKLREAKEAAKVAEHGGSVHCPEWLSAQVKPKGDRAGGYPFLIETEDFTVKVAGEAQTMWPGLVIELRSHFLHANLGGARGACEEALCWVRDLLLYDARESAIGRRRPSKACLSRAWISISTGKAGLSPVTPLARNGASSGPDGHSGIPSMRGIPAWGIASAVASP